VTKFAFGQVSFDRGSIPENLRDLSAWPSVDVSALSEDDQTVFVARQTAIELYIQNPNLSLIAIRDQTGVDPKTVYRIMDRCLSKTCGRPHLWVPGPHSVCTSQTIRTRALSRPV
jgi:putative transposase